MNEQIAINCYLHYGFAKDGKYLFSLIDNYIISKSVCDKYTFKSVSYMKLTFAREIQGRMQNLFGYTKTKSICNYEEKDIALIRGCRYFMCSDNLHVYDFITKIIFYCLRKYGYRRINHMKHYFRVRIDYYRLYLLLCKQEPIYAIFSNYGEIQKGLRKIIQTKGFAMSLMCFQHIATVLFLIGEQTWNNCCVVNPFVMVFCNDYLLFMMCKFL
jgi:hypothetical protein